MQNVPRLCVEARWTSNVCGSRSRRGMVKRRKLIRRLRKSATQKSPEVYSFSEPLLKRKPTIQGSITIPGCLTATTLSRGIDIEEGFGMSATTAPSMGGSATTPLVYYYGHASVAENPKHYKILVDKLAQSVNSRMNEDAEGKFLSFCFLPIQCSQ